MPSWTVELWVNNTRQPIPVANWTILIREQPRQVFSSISECVDISVNLRDLTELFLSLLGDSEPLSMSLLLVLVFNCGFDLVFSILDSTPFISAFSSTTSTCCFDDSSVALTRPIMLDSPLSTQLGLLLVVIGLVLMLMLVLVQSLDVILFCLFSKLDCLLDSLFVSLVTVPPSTSWSGGNRFSADADADSGGDGDVEVAVAVGGGGDAVGGGGGSVSPDLSASLGCSSFD